MKYWRTYQKDLIMKILSAIKEEGLEILIWQNNKEKKQTYSTKIHGLKKNELILHFTGDSKNQVQFFEPNKPYYAHIQKLETHG